MITSDKSPPFMRYSIQLLLILIAVFLFDSCKEAVVAPPLDIVPGSTIQLACDDTELMQRHFEQMDDNDLLVQGLIEGTNSWTIRYQDETIFVVPHACFDIISRDEINWLMHISIEGSESFSVGYVGDFQLTITPNPSGYAPLTAEIEAEAPREFRLSIRVDGQDGPVSDIVHHFSGFASNMTIPVLGLYPDDSNTVELSFYDANDLLYNSVLVSITTDPLPENVLPEISIPVRQFDQMEPGFNLVSYRTAVNPNIPFWFDAWGKIRGVFLYYAHPQLGLLGYDVGMERLANGNYYFGDWNTDAIYEVDVFGNTLNTWPLPSGYQFHHNVQEKPDGNFLVTVDKEGATHLNGNNTVEDHIIEINRQSGAMVQEWDLRQSLDEYRVAQINQLSSAWIDWAHANAVIYDESDQTIIVSCRTQGLVKLDYNNQVQWLLGPHLGYGTNRQGDDLNDFLLAPVDGAGTLIDDQQVVEGYANHPDFEWQWYQHAPLLLPNGHILLFDNGDTRNWTFAERYSRAVEYDIDETNGTVQQVWQYGKERGNSAFSRLVSDVDYLPERDNILFCPGSYVDNTPAEFGGKIIEIDYTTREVVFEATLSSGGITFHRAERMPIYPEGL